MISKQNWCAFFQLLLTSKDDLHQQDQELAKQNCTLSIYFLPHCFAFG